MIRNLNLLICFSGMFLTYDLVQAQHHPSAAFEISSTTQGLLPPRMSQAQRDAIAQPSVGLMVFCTDCQSEGVLYLYTGDNRWMSLNQVTPPHTVADADGNTGLQTEKTANDNSLRFQTDGVERLTLDSNGRLHLMGAFLDSSGSAGKAGQVLASTSSGTRWIDPPTPKRFTDRNGADGQVLTPTDNGFEWADLPIPHRIADNDGNTQIQTEETIGENILRFDTNGVERMTLNDNGRLYLAGAFRDSSGTPGTTGQFLASTANGTRWIDAPSPTTITDASGNTGKEGEILAINPNGQLQWIPPNQIPDANGNTGSTGQILSINQNGQLEWIDNNSITDATGSTGDPSDLLYIDASGNPQWTSFDQIRDATGSAGSKGQLLSLDQNKNLIWVDRNEITDASGQKGTDGQVLTINQNGKLQWMDPPLPKYIADRDRDTQVQVEKSQDSDRIQFDTGNQERLTIDSAGHVGIGNTNPDDRLDVDGNAHISGAFKDSSGSAGASGQMLASTGNGTRWSNARASNNLAYQNTQIQVEESPNENKIRFDTGGVERAIIDQNGNMGVGTDTPQTSAILELSSTSKGFLPPRMSTAQRNAISPKTEGMMLYNTNNKELEVWNGSDWECVANCNKMVVHSLDLNNDGDFDDPGEYDLRRYGFIVSPATGKRWLDRNIGATRVATGVNDVAVLGDNKGLGFYYSLDDAKKACPSGYHLPTNREWCAELDIFDTDCQGRELTNPKGFRNAQTAFDHLKLIFTSWSTRGTGTVANADVFQDYSSLWSSDEGYMYFNSTGARLNGIDPSFNILKTHGLSVRCIQD